MEQVAHKAIVRDLENRSFLIFVDGHDDLCVLHARKMLDGSRNPNRDIKLGRYNLTRLTNLIVVGDESCVNSGAACAYGCAELVRNPLKSLKFSPDCIPRPPDITIFAAVSSGRSDFDTSSLTN